MPATGRRVPLELAVRREDIDEHIEKLSFSFFYKYSRFEFALKEHGYLRHSRLGCSAMPGWHEFAKDLCGEYRMSPEAAELIGLAPNSQVIAANGRLQWKKVNLDTCLSELEKIMLVVQTVRNKLFHGGKYDANGWDNPERTATFLTLEVAVLDQIAERTGLEADYTRHY